MRLGAALAWTQGPALVVWEPGMAHRYGRDDAPWRHSWIHAQGAALRRIAAASLLPRGQPIVPIDRPRIERDLAEIRDEVGSRATPDPVILDHLLENLFRRCMRVAASPDARGVPEDYLRVRRHLETAYAAPIALAQLAAMVQRSERHFCSTYRRWFGVSPIDYVITLRLQRASVLLADRNRGIGEVARAVGFGDLRYFAKAFRRRYGCAPSGVRRRG